MTETFLYKRNLTDKSQSSLNIWLAFPGIYNFGMSSLGFLSIFKRFDLQPDHFVERIFTDTKNTELEVKEVDILGFSISFELDFLSVFKIMEKYSIPFKSESRDEEMPLIFAGGPVMSANPEPFAEIFDFFIIGDAENITIITDFIKDNKNLKKSELLKKLVKLDGVYVPKYKKEYKNKKIKKLSADLNECLATPILTENTFFSNTYIIELVRGCPQKCGFCLASYQNLPVRFADYEQIISNINFALQYTNKIAFLGALIASHPRFDDICKYVYNLIKSGKNVELSVSSLRVDSISDDVVKTLVAAGQKNVTIAIEAGSERLRTVINKKLKEEQIFKAIEIAQRNGLKGVKIYAMIGLPTETQEDIEALVDLANRLKKKYKYFDFTFSFSTFVPKAHTPFQFYQRENSKSLETKYNYIKKSLHKIGVKERFSSIKWDYIQALFSRGDSRLADYAIEVYKNGANLGAFKNVYKEMRKKNLLPPADDIALKELSLKDELPWSFIETFSSKETLIAEYKRLLNN